MQGRWGDLRVIIRDGQTRFKKRKRADEWKVKEQRIEGIELIKENAKRSIKMAIRDAIVLIATKTALGGKP